MLSVHHPDSANSSSASSVEEDEIDRSMENLAISPTTHSFDTTTESGKVHSAKDALFSTNSISQCSHVRQALKDPLSGRILRALKEARSVRLGKKPMECVACCHQASKPDSSSSGSIDIGCFVCSFCLAYHCKRHSFLHFMQSGHDVFVDTCDDSLSCFKCEQNMQQEIAVSKSDSSRSKHAIKYTLKRIFSSLSTSQSEMELDSMSKGVNCRGMQNLGNTCYFNSAIQALRSSYYLETFMHSHARSLAHGSHPVYSAFLGLLNQFHLSDKKPVNSASFIRAFSKNWMQIGSKGQQDPQEFILFLLGSISDEIQHSRDLDILQEFNDAFQSRYCVSLYCNGCGNVSKHDEFFYCLSLGLPKLVMFDEPLNVDYLLSDFVRPHPCGYRCEKCRSENVIYSMAGLNHPNILILHLKRFNVIHHHNSSPTSTNGKGKQKVSIEKDRRHVNFELLLNITAEDEMEYELSAVIVHIGESYNSGHYICYVKIENCWFYTSDTSVRRVPFAEVQNAQAYILIYNKLI